MHDVQCRMRIWMMLLYINGHRWGAQIYTAIYRNALPFSLKPTIFCSWSVGCLQNHIWKARDSEPRSWVTNQQLRPDDINKTLIEHFEEWRTQCAGGYLTYQYSYNPVACLDNITRAGNTENFEWEKGNDIVQNGIADAVTTLTCRHVTSVRCSVNAFRIESMQKTSRCKLQHSGKCVDGKNNRCTIRSIKNEKIRVLFIVDGIPIGTVISPK